jgi:hypothetical protein
LALCGIIAAFCLGSCLTFTDELDLNKEISLDMQIGPGGLFIPVGSLDTLFLDSLIKVDGDESLLDTLDGGLFGFTMKDSISKIDVGIDPVKIDIEPPHIDPLETEFDNPDVKDVEILRRESSTTLDIPSIDLSDMNLPSFRRDTTVGPYDVPAGYGTAIPTIGITINPEAMGCNFTYEFPEDVKKLNKLWFGETKGSKNGQKLTLDVNLEGIYNALTDPKVKVSSLVISFPNNFILAKDADLDAYIPSSCVSVTGNVFSIAMTSQTVSGVNANRHLPITFYVKYADFSDPIYENQIDYHETIQYNLDLSIDGVAGDVATTFEVGVNLEANLKMADIEAETVSRNMDVEEESITSNCAVTNLDGINRVNVITFDPDESKLYLSVSDLNMDPFALQNGVSKIDLRFSPKFTFDEEYCKDETGQDAGTWLSASRLSLDATKAIGHTVALKVKELAVNQVVDELTGSIEITTEVSYSGKVVVAENDNVDLAAIDSLNNMNKKLLIACWGKFVVASAEIETGEMRTVFQDSTEISINEHVDNTLVMVKRIDLTEPAGAVMNLLFEGVPETVTELTFSRFTVEFPEFIKIAYDGPDARINVKGNKLIINGVLDEELHSPDGFSVNGLTITGMEFAEPLWLDNGNLVLDNQKVRLNGTVTVNNQKIKSDELSVIKVTPTVSFNTIEVKSVYGKVDPKIDPVHEEVSLDLGDSDFFQNENNTLSLSDPQLTINLTSTVTVPIDIDLKLSSLDAKGNYIAKDIAPDGGTIHLAKCDTTADSRTTTLVIYKNERQVPANSDTMYIRMSRLSELMSTIPDKIVFDLSAGVDQSVNHFIDLTRELSVSGDYNVSIPLMFDNLYLEYSDTIKELGKDLEDVVDKIDAVEVQLVGEVESTIPLGVTLTAKAYDKNWNELTDVRISSFSIKAGSDTITKAPMVLDVDVKKNGLEKLESIIFTASCESAEGGFSIHKGQWLLVKKLRIKFPQGLKVDLTDVAKDDKNKEGKH